MAYLTQKDDLILISSEHTSFPMGSPYDERLHVYQISLDGAESHSTEKYGLDTWPCHANIIQLSNEHYGYCQGPEIRQKLRIFFPIFKLFWSKNVFFVALVFRS